MTASTYSTATAFRQALEARFQSKGQGQSADIQRMRRQVSFDRLLCRLFQHTNELWLLKGGYAMELRLQESRTTRDIDLMARSKIGGSGRLSDRMLRHLQAAASLDLNDFFVFAIGQPIQDLANAVYGGYRFPVEVRMAGRIFSRFHLDVAAGDPVLEPVETVQGGDWLAFAGVPTVGFPSICREQQFAEKLHAYTLPRVGRQNTRVRDLLDMVLLIRMGLEGARLSEAVSLIYARRNTHSLPKTLPPPPDSWVTPFAALAEECSVSMNVNQAFATVAGFLAQGGFLV